MTQIAGKKKALTFPELLFAMLQRFWARPWVRFAADPMMPGWARGPC